MVSTMYRNKVAAVLLLCAGCHAGTATPGYLAAAPEPYRSLTHAPIIDLPDTGGILINGYRIAHDSVATFFQAMRGLPPDRRAVFFGRIGGGRFADAAWVDGVGHAFEIQLYSAHATWPNAGPPPGFRVIRPDEDL